MSKYETTGCQIPGAHEHHYICEGRTAVALVDSHGVVEITEQMLDELLTAAGWAEALPKQAALAADSAASEASGVSVDPDEDGRAL